jgi:ABC-type spermidine/putrescine transport system permease subunit I|tara:strand:- start:638 stop:844 length:207 start_codon:yes stop_codon:yes gene_type:complete
MGAARAVVFGGVVTLPALLIGVVLFLILGGANEDWANWMWFPCYILPTTIILATSIYGWKTDIPVDLE